MDRDRVVTLSRPDPTCEKRRFFVFLRGYCNETGLFIFLAADGGVRWTGW